MFVVRRTAFGTIVLLYYKANDTSRQTFSIRSAENPCTGDIVHVLPRAVAQSISSRGAGHWTTKNASRTMRRRVEGTWWVNSNPHGYNAVVYRTPGHQFKLQWRTQCICDAFIYSTSIAHYAPMSITVIRYLRESMMKQAFDAIDVVRWMSSRNNFSHRVLHAGKIEITRGQRFDATPSSTVLKWPHRVLQSHAVRSRTQLASRQYSRSRKIARNYSASMVGLPHAILSRSNAGKQSAIVSRLILQKGEITGNINDGHLCIESHSPVPFC